MKKIMLILGFVFLITSLFAILVLSVNFFWPKGWSGSAQATLAAAITTGIVAILGTYLKFIFDQISLDTAYNQKISEKMISKVHTYAEDYYIPLLTYARFSASQLYTILTNANAPVQEKQLALFFITKYFQYLLKLCTEKGGIIFLKNFDSESCLEQLNARARKNLKLTTDQICKLQSIPLEDTPLDFSTEIRQNGELMEIYKTFEEWLDNNKDNVKKTIAYFHCYDELMRHELNLIYMPWYQRKAPQILPNCKRVLRAFKKLEKLEKKLEKLGEKKDKGKIAKNKYEEKKKWEEKNLNDSISGFFKD